MYIYVYIYIYMPAQMTRDAAILANKALAQAQVSEILRLIYIYIL